MLARTKSDFFLMLTLIAFLLVSGVALTLNVRRPVEDTIFVNEASEIDTAEPGKTDLEGGLIFDFPEFPIYPGSEVLNSYKKEEGDRVGFSASWQSYDRVNDIARWYFDRLEALGWTITISPDPDPEGVYTEQFIQAQKGDLLVNVIIEVEEGDPTEIDVEFPVQPLELY